MKEIHFPRLLGEKTMSIPHFRYELLRVQHRIGDGLTMFISVGNPHLTSRFCGVVLGPTTISKMNHTQSGDISTNFIT